MYEQTMNNDLTMTGGDNPLLAGRYQVVRQLGTGGMGSVWLAEDRQLDNKLFAVKMLPSLLVSNKRAYRQLKDEALVAMRLVHPNIVQIRAFEENNGNPFLVMDYIEGQTLDDYLAEKGKLSEDETIQLLKPIAAALDYAHGEGVVHRDVKPANIMIRKDGHPYILDFGIAREIQETMTRVTGKLSSGTLLYMSPEQLRGQPPKAVQDVYSFAAMVYECLKGEPPFSRGQIEYQILNEKPAPLPDGVKLSASIMRGLSKEPETRPDSCASVLFVASPISQSHPVSTQICTAPRRMSPQSVERQPAPQKNNAAGLMLQIGFILAALFIIGGVMWGRNAHQKETGRNGVITSQPELNPPLPIHDSSDGEDFTVYVVQQGDYLAKISKKYNVPLSSIKRLNPELENGALRIGQRIKLPGRIEVGGQVDSTPTTEAVKPYTSYVGPVTEYVVKEGDSLAGIAYRNGINLRQMRELNGLGDHATIRVGQILKIPNNSIIVSDENNAKRARALTDDQIKALLDKGYNGATAFKVDVPPKPKQTIKPDYPESSRKRGEEGDVSLEFSVNRNGGVDRVFVLRSSGFPDLDDAAVQAVKCAEFDPAKSGDMPVSSVARLTLSFKLRDALKSSSDVGRHNSLVGSWSCSTTLTGSKWMSEMEYKYDFNENGFYTSRLVGNAITGKTKGEKTIITEQGNWSIVGDRLTLRCESFSVNDSPAKPKEAVYTYNVLWKKDGTFELRQANLEQVNKNGKTTYTYDSAGREIKHSYLSTGEFENVETAKIFRCFR